MLEDEVQKNVVSNTADVMVMVTRLKGSGLRLKFERDSSVRLRDSGDVMVTVTFWIWV